MNYYSTYLMDLNFEGLSHDEIVHGGGLMVIVRFYVGLPVNDSEVSYYEHPRWTETKQNNETNKRIRGATDNVKGGSSKKQRIEKHVKYPCASDVGKQTDTERDPEGEQQQNKSKKGGVTMRLKRSYGRSEGRNEVQRKRSVRLPNRKEEYPRAT